MRRHGVTRMICWLAVLLMSAGAAAVGAEETIGKNPGKFKGRWLRVFDQEALKAHDRAVIGTTSTDIAWKRAENEAPLQERELDAQLREQLLERLNESGLYSDVLSEPNAADGENYLRVDCVLEVEPGSRLLRYAAGGGAGKSRSILECEFVDQASGRVLAMYHGYGSGTGLGFKLAGGGAAKMTKDDNQENTAKIVELLKRVAR